MENTVKSQKRDIVHLQQALDAQVAKYQLIDNQRANFKSQVHQSLDEKNRLKKEVSDLREEKERWTRKTQRMAVEIASLQQSKAIGNLHLLSSQKLREMLALVTEKSEAILKEMDKRNECIMCRERERNIFLLPCRHIIMCDQCYNKEFGRRRYPKAVCPVCKTEIKDGHQILM